MRQIFMLAVLQALAGAAQAALQVKDVRLQRGRASAPRLYGEIGSPQSPAREILDAVREEHPDSQWIFSGQRPGTPHAGTSACHGLARACEQAKITNFHWHDLRHTFCSRLVMRGVPLRTVQILAGHKTITVTERYAHLAPEHLQEAVAMLDGTLAPTTG